MSHLVCTDHARRVMVVNKKALHRSDSSKCETKNVKAGEKTISVDSEHFHHGKQEL